MPPLLYADLDEAAARLRRKGEEGTRQIVGLVGPPGAGKTTAAGLLSNLFGSESAVVPMDGFHLANTIIDGTPLKERKGAIDTFDVGGYLSLLERLRHNHEDVIYAPSYRRGLEEPIAASIAVPREVKFVFTEGNYLLARRGRWGEVRNYLDEAWFVETPSETRIARLIERHVAYGMEPAAAEVWANGSDETNARYIETTKAFADLIVRWG
ncbi:nucleoside/nucleotide kinase family protein [Paenarthrobacter sp. NPDC089675]|uniref:nucleoside/nucleotide kinase family protein n=1 Tax=Paenarthrobacter sp. NPDC089675 TaxID=3364376 RepID=UPI00381B2E51